MLKALTPIEKARQSARDARYAREVDALKGFNRRSDEPCQPPVYRLVTSDRRSGTPPEIEDEILTHVAAAPGFGLATLLMSPTEVPTADDVMIDPIVAWGIGRERPWPITLSTSPQELANGGAFHAWSILRPDGCLEGRWSFHESLEGWIRESYEIFLEDHAVREAERQKARTK